MGGMDILSSRLEPGTEGGASSSPLNAACTAIDKEGKFSIILLNRSTEKNQNLVLDYMYSKHYLPSLMSDIELSWSEMSLNDGLFSDAHSQHCLIRS